MNVKTTQWAVSKFSDLIKKETIRRSAEYQRGECWTSLQKQKFIDSMYRGYPLPAIFIHVVKEADPGDLSFIHIFPSIPRDSSKLRHGICASHPDNTELSVRHGSARWSRALDGNSTALTWGMNA